MSIPLPDPSPLALAIGDETIGVDRDIDEPAATNHRVERDRGQATTEYALVLLAAALIAVLVIGWATAGGGAAAIGRLFDAVIDAVIGKI